MEIERERDGVRLSSINNDRWQFREIVNNNLQIYTFHMYSFLSTDQTMWLKLFCFPATAYLLNIHINTSFMVLCIAVIYPSYSISLVRSLRLFFFFRFACVCMSLWAANVQYFYRISDIGNQRVCFAYVAIAINVMMLSLAFHWHWNNICI